MIGVFLEGNMPSLGAGNRMAGIRVCNDTDSRNASFFTHQLIRCLSWHYRRAAGAGTGGGGLVLVSSAGIVLCGSAWIPDLRARRTRAPAVSRCHACNKR